VHSLASIKTTAQQLTKSTTIGEVKLLAELVGSLADAFEHAENKAKQAYAEAQRVKAELKRLERGTDSSRK
jgi:hypothetical protein